MTQSLIPIDNTPKSEPLDLQVSGLHDFPEARWREGIAFYLKGVHTNEAVMHRPKIAFGSAFALRLHGGEYTAYHLNIEDERPALEIPKVEERAALCVGSTIVEVESALKRFSSEEHLRMLIIRIGDNGAAYLWKLPNGRLGAASHGLASFLDFCRKTDKN